MTGVLGVAGMIAVAAITPGPNNLVVLRAAIGSGLLGAIPVMLAIIAGGLVVVGAALAGAGVAFAADGRLRGALAIAGSLYMLWLGIRSIVDARRAHLPQATHGTRRHDTVRGLFLFQLMNPKCWVMVLTAVAAAPGRPWLLTAAFVMIPAGCLSVWAALGASLSSQLQRPAVAAWVDRILGALLVACAVALLADGVRP